MNANKINEIIDKGEDVGQDLLSSYVIDQVISKLALASGGFAGLLVTKALGFVLNKYIFPALTTFKINNISYNIDVKAEGISASKIKESENEDEFIKNITGY